MRCQDDAVLEGEKRSEEWSLCFERGGMVLVQVVSEGICISSEVGNILFYVSELEK